MHYMLARATTTARDDTAGESMEDEDDANPPLFYDLVDELFPEETDIPQSPQPVQPLSSLSTASSQLSSPSPVSPQLSLSPSPASSQLPSSRL